MSILYAAGACFMAYYGLKSLKFIHQLWNESIRSKPLDFKKYGDWAVITGASYGIGKAVAMELARCGLNVVLLARTKSKLELAAREIEEECGVTVKILVVDFTDSNMYDEIEQMIEGLNISVLVNNVGMAFLKPTPLLDIPDHEKYSSDLINVNVYSMLKLTEMILPQMVSRKGGIVTNIASVIGTTETPFFAVYGATKSLMIKFTEAMRQEYKGQGVIFQCISPAITATPAIAATTESNFMIPTPELYGKYVIKALGKSAYTNTGFFWHNVFQLVLGNAPSSLLAKGMESEAQKASLEKSRQPLHNVLES